jgi:hypothetical protein
MIEDWSRYLFLAGALPFVILGFAHAYATPTHLDVPRGLSPSDVELAKAMSRTRLRLTARTDMWLAWMGFNFSHSLGVLLFGAVVLVIGRSTKSFEVEGRIFVPLSVFVSALYFLLASKYWFRTPIVACALSLVLFLASWVLLILARR